LKASEEIIRFASFTAMPTSSKVMTQNQEDSLKKFNFVCFNKAFIIPNSK